MHVLLNFLLLFYSVPLSWEQKIKSISISPSKVFPIELGETVTLQITPVSGTDYEDATISFELGNEKAYRIYRSGCTGPLESSFVCKYNPLNVIFVSYTPVAEHYGLELEVTYFPDSESLWKSKSAPVFKEKIELTKQPSYVSMSMKLTEPSRHLAHIPTSLRLDPPVFLTGSHVHIDCDSDGTLPPRPITFTVECPPPNTAVVEADRVNQASQGLSYERYYQTYGFYSPPSLADLAPYVGRKHADELLRLGHVYRRNETSIRAVLSLTGRAHDCHVVCRLAGKETRRRLTVYHPTTISYLLPRPRNLQMEVGSEITCYADGHPPPTLSLRLAQPLKPPQAFTEAELEALRKVGRLPEKIEGDMISKELMLTDSGLELLPEDQRRAGSGSPGSGSGSGDSIAQAGTLHRTPGDFRDRWPHGGGGSGGLADREPYKMTDRIPGVGLFTVDRDRMLGIRPWEYTIEGGTFRLADNATPGVELLLTCKARNMLPGDTTFLNVNGTITRVRFVVIARSRASIGISLGVCAAVLLLVLIVVAVMLSQKRRQSGNSTTTMGNSTGARGTTGAVGRPGGLGSSVAGVLNGKSARNYPTDQYQKGTLVSAMPPPPNHSADLGSFANTTTSIASIPNRAVVQSLSSRDLGNSPPHAAPQGHYADLSFDAGSQALHHRDRPQSLRGGERGGVASTSMTLYTRGPSATVAAVVSPQTRGISVPQDLDTSVTLPFPSVRGGNEQGGGDPVPGVGYPVGGGGLQQPRAYSSQLVLQQQQEATQTLLGMQRKKPSVLV